MPITNWINNKSITKLNYEQRKNWFFHLLQQNYGKITDFFWFARPLFECNLLSTLSVLWNWYSDFCYEIIIIMPFLKITYSCFTTNNICYWGAIDATLLCTFISHILEVIHSAGDIGGHWFSNVRPIYNRQLFPVLGRQEWPPLCSSVAVADLLQSQMCYDLRDALLHNHSCL